MAGEQVVQNDLRRRLKDVLDRSQLIGLHSLGHNGEQSLRHRPLDTRRLKLVIQQIRLVQLAVHIPLGQPRPDLGRVLIRQLIKDVNPLPLPLNVPAAKEISGFSAHHQDGHLHFGISGLPEILGRLSQDVRVEGPAKSLVGGNDHQSLASRLRPHEKRVLLGIGPQGQRADHLLEFARIGTGLRDSLLGTAQLRRGHHLHGLRDLLRAFDAIDAPADIPKRRHDPCPVSEVRRPRSTSRGSTVAAGLRTFDAQPSTLNWH